MSSKLEKLEKEHGEGFIEFCVNFVTEATLDAFGGYRFPRDPAPGELEALKQHIIDAVKIGPRYVDEHGNVVSVNAEKCSGDGKAKCC